MKNLCITLLCACLLAVQGCEQGKRNVVSGQVKSMLSHFPRNIHARLGVVNGNLGFWKRKLERQPAGFLYAEEIATCFDERFALEGHIEDIDSSNQYLKRAIELRKDVKTAPLHQRYIGNLIKLHRFAEAERMSRHLMEKYPADLGFQLLRFDALMELGEYAAAGHCLARYIGMHDNFDLLIRQAKYADHEGNLEQAILLMEKAHAMAEHKAEAPLLGWVKTILGEYYTHQGALAKGAGLFEEAVCLDPTLEYAWLNLGWLLYSHEGNARAYEQLLKALNIKQTPDITWKLAEFYRSTGDSIYRTYTTQFYEQASQPKYKGWYEPKLALIESEYFENHKRAIDLAHAQVEMRPTHDSYDLLSWCLYQSGDLESAQAIYDEHLLDQTDEPLMQYHGGAIYAALGAHGKAVDHLQAAGAARFELGPAIYHEIDRIKDQLPFVYL